MESEKRAPSAASTPQSAEAVFSVSSTVEKELRGLIKGLATQQEYERRHRAEAAVKEGKKPEKEKPGWAEPLQKVIRSQIEALMASEGFTDADWTLKTPVAAKVLKDIVERGKVGKGDIPADYRQFVAEYCRKKGEDPDAILRSLGLLWAGRLVGYSKKPAGQELDPETMQFLAGLHYEFGEVSAGHGKQETEGRAQRGPKQIAARMESRVPMVRDSAVDEFGQHLMHWVVRAPSDEDERKEHFADVSHAIDVADRVLDTVSHMDIDQKRSLRLSMTDAHAKMARKSGAA